MTRPDANLSQEIAADPAHSVWVTANAGSGKTRVLTSRVARLLLRGVDPQNILCLTYTKAAAAEMQIRLFDMLGKWAMAPEAALSDEIDALGEDRRAFDPATARRLFARALEVPGGLRIQTIHSFCGSLLRRFPMEAGVSPGFQELDERSASRLRGEVLEDMAARICPELFDSFLSETGASDLDMLAATIAGAAAQFPPVLAPEQIARACGASPGDSLEALLQAAFAPGDAEFLARVAATLATADPKTSAALAGLPAIPGEARLLAMEDLFVYGPDKVKAGQPKVDALPRKDARPLLGKELDALHAIMARIANLADRRRALTALRKTLALHRFARAFLDEYQRRKIALGALDFDDLITKARALLGERGQASWVLFRLDGRIDHILVDEAQDTSPRQWDIIRALTSEFTAGEGQGARDRTLFVVGDMKQSIYSFQGADLRVFEDTRDRVLQDFAHAGGIAQPALLHSFRSSPAVLAAVDATFGNRFARALGRDEVHHLAHWAQTPGRVDLWPMIEPSAKESEDSTDPVDFVGQTHHHKRLAEQIARQISQMIQSGTMIPGGAEGPRPVTAGDVLILVQRRKGLFRAIIAACKSQGLPIAGADRMDLADELVVNDIRALLAFLATPEDDLSLAVALRSPLLGWQENDLFHLAHARPGYLWEALRKERARFPRTIEMLEDLRNRADYLRPFELIEHLLNHHGGRARLIGRLGAECKDALDEFLQQALAYETVEAPSLTGFLAWLHGDTSQVKRQVGGAAEMIRVMTVHGAKGLEAPVVILAETEYIAPQRLPPILPVLPPGGVSPLALWSGPAADHPPSLAAVTLDLQDRGYEERLRLLYVAMTRARNWLIVAGAGDPRDVIKDGKKSVPRPAEQLCWHSLVRQGMERLASETLPGGILRHGFGDWPDPGTARPPAPPAAPPDLPDWLALTPPPRPQLRPDRSPSDLGGAKILPQEAADPSQTQAALERGGDVHLLLQYLPERPAAAWPDLAGRLIPDPARRQDALAAATRILTDPACQPVFAPGALAEVPLAVTLDGQRFLGTIDRLLVRPDQVLAVDFKTNRRIPAHASEVPEGILRQMGAYEAMLRALYPDRRIDLAILWTQTARLMPLDPEIVRSAFARAAIP